jgi:hypothetical protein
MKTFWRLTRKDYYFTAIDLKKIFPELKDLYTENIVDRLRGSDLDFYYSEKVKTPIWIRLTLPIALIVMLTLFILTPVNYMITGYWGYKYKSLTNWLRSLGF